MKVLEALDTATDSITVKRVFAEPYETEGLTVIAAAAVTGGAGGGSGTDPRGQQGEGGGLGVHARPVGAYVIKDGQLHWRPAVDANRVLTLACLLGIVYLLRGSSRTGSRPLRVSI